MERVTGYHNGVALVGLRYVEPEQALIAFHAWAGARWPKGMEWGRPELILVDSRDAIRNKPLTP